MRRGEIERQALVDALAAQIAERRDGRMAGRRQPPEERLRYVRDLRPRQTYYADSAAADRGCDGRDGVARYLISCHGQVCRD